PEVFEAAQQQSQHNARFSRRNRKHEYLFTGGRLRCGRCGASMTGVPAKNGLRYRCISQFKHFPGDPFCEGYIRAEHIEPQVWQEIERALNDPALIMFEFERQAREEAATTGDITKELSLIEKSLAALTREAQRWDDAYAHDVIDLAELKAK